MHLSKPMFNNTNNSDNNDNTNNTPWGNPEVANNAFQWPSNNNNNQSIFQMWPNNNTNNNNPFGNNNFQSVFAKNNTKKSNNSNNSNNNEWWSSANNNTNTSTPSKPSNNNFWGSTEGQTTNNNDNNDKMDADNDINVREPGTNALNQNKHTFNTKSKPTKLEATPQSQPFIGNWQFGPKNYQGKKPIVFVAIKHKQPDPNQLIGLVNKQPKHNLKVTSFGIVARTESNRAYVLRGILHVSVRDKASLSILWHDDHDNHQHYWNQPKCKGFESGHCQYGTNCRFAHVDATLTQQLQANNQRVAQLQQIKQSKKQQNNQSRFDGNNMNVNGRNKGNYIPRHKESVDNKEEKGDGSFKTTNGLHVSPKRSPNTNTMRRLSPRALKSYKNPFHREEGLSFTTTYFNPNGESMGTYISTQDAATSNTVAVPQREVASRGKEKEEMMDGNEYSFDDEEQKDKKRASPSPSPSVDVNQIHEPGKCYLMCPQSESHFRITNALCNKRFEYDIHGNVSKYSLIKEYSKSNAGQTIGLKDLRCGSVLRLTMQYLMNIPLNDTTTPFCRRYVFLEDRIRAICKDIYAGHLMKIDGESTIELLETAVRFRIFCHVLMCHMDQTVSQQTKAFPASTQYQSAFLNQNINIPVDSNSKDVMYSTANNLNHLHNIFKLLLSLYKSRNFDRLSAAQQNDEIAMYCLRAYYMLVNGAMNYRDKKTNYHYEAKEILCNDVPRYIRAHARVKLARSLIDAYSTMNRSLFFKLYQNRLTFMEQAVLYPMLDSFRLLCIKKMCNRGNIRLPPNTTYRFNDFVVGFGFYDNKVSPSVDATDFLVWFGGFYANDMNRICNNGLTMDDFSRIKQCKDGQRFAARDAFLLSIERNGLQRLFQASSYCRINHQQFHKVFVTIESAKDIHFVDAEVNNMFRSTIVSSPPAPRHPPKQRPAKAVVLAPPSQPSAFGKGFDINFLKKQQSNYNAPSFEPKRAPSPPLETVDDIISSNDSSLQRMVHNEEWKQLFETLSSFKKKYSSHPSWIAIKKWIKSYIETQRRQYKNEWDDLKSRESKRNWNKFYDFVKKWNPIVSNDIKIAMREIKKNWFKFKKNEVIYYKNKRFNICSISLDLKKETPPTMKLCGEHNEEIVINMFDDTIITEKDYIKQKELQRLQREKEELQRQIALKQLQEKRRKEEIERKRRENEAKQRAEEEKRLKALRAKLEEEERKKREKQRREQLKKEQIEALKKCNTIYETLRLKRFINEWKHKAFELAKIRKHYRLNHDDDILNKTQSMNETLLLLQSHSPIKRNPRKRREPNDDSYLRRLKRPRLNPFRLSWNHVDIINALYESNKETLHSQDLMFSILISGANEFVLKHFGCDDTKQELCKRVFVDGDIRLHFCVISDTKIRAIGAIHSNSIKGFQGYVHVLSHCALLDFDLNKCVWSLHKERIDDLISNLKKDGDKMRDNFSLLHSESECSVLILIFCQPLYTSLRGNEDALNTLIKFNDNDCFVIKRALGINNVNNVCIMGIPSWPNATQNMVFKYGMKWMVSAAPKYPKMYKTGTCIINNIFEKIFDSSPQLLSLDEKIVLWNAEINKLTSSVLSGICNISWPPCCFDDKHELVMNEVLSPSFWNNNNTKNKILQSLEMLKISDAQSKSNPTKYIIRHIGELDKYWWTMTDIRHSIADLFTECSISDTYDTDNDNDNNDTLSANSVQLMEFDELLNDISTHFDSTLQGLKTCSQVIHSMNNRINGLE